MTLRLGSLFTGYAGLDLGVVQQQAVAALRLLMARMAAWGEEAAA